MTIRRPVAPLLVIAATDLELAPLRARLGGGRGEANAWGPAFRGRWADHELVLQALGVGKVHTAAGLALAIASWEPQAVVQVGIGGAYLGSFLSVGMTMWADVELELDLGVARGDGWADQEALAIPLIAPRPGSRRAGREVGTSPALTRALATAGGLPRGRFATLDAVTSDIDRGAALQDRFDVSIESMEGAAAATVADRLGVPFAEVRAVSNIAGERDHARWDLRGAVAAAGDAVARALGSLPAPLPLDDP